MRRREPWSFSLEFMLGESLRGKTFGVIGPGRIGRAAARARGGVSARRAIFAGRGDPLGELLGAADVVSLHCPLTAETRHLIDARALAKMRPTAVLVNTARGPIVDERALVAALRDGTIARRGARRLRARAGGDAEELLALDNVVLTPHLGSATRDTREAMGLLAVDALRAVLLEGRRPANALP